jgi:hypothetical protein
MEYSLPISGKLRITVACSRHATSRMSLMPGCEAEDEYIMSESVAEPYPPGFFDMFTTESDRACAVLAGALLDSLLEHLLRKAMVPDSSQDLFRAQGPLGSFAAKIDLALAVGLSRMKITANSPLCGASAMTLLIIWITISTLRPHILQIACELYSFQGSL